MGETGARDGGCTCHDQHQVTYGSVKSLHCTPETHTTLYVNCYLDKI